MEDRGDVSVLDMSKCNARTRAMVQAALKIPTAKHKKVARAIKKFRRRKEKERERAGCASQSFNCEGHRH